MVENKTNKHIAVFSGQNLNYDAQEFNGAKLTAVFGGIDLDLTNAKIQNDAEIRICTIFGGVDIKVPKGTAVVVKATSIFGGTENKVEVSQAEKIIYVKAFSLFGGCDIKMED